MCSCVQVCRCAFVHVCLSVGTSRRQWGGCSRHGRSMWRRASLPPCVRTSVAREMTTPRNAQICALPRADVQQRVRPNGWRSTHRYAMLKLGRNTSGCVIWQIERAALMGVVAPRQRRKEQDPDGSAWTEGGQAQNNARAGHGLWGVIWGAILRSQSRYKGAARAVLPICAVRRNSWPTQARDLDR